MTINRDDNDVDISILISCDECHIGINTLFVSTRVCFATPEFFNMILLDEDHQLTQGLDMDNSNYFEDYFRQLGLHQREKQQIQYVDINSTSDGESKEFIYNCNDTFNLKSDLNFTKMFF